MPRESGTVTVNGHPLGRMRKEVAYVPQRSEVDWNFPITVEQTAKLGTYPKLGLFTFPRATATATTAAALEQVDLLELKDRPISQLSGGQQQRKIGRASCREGEDSEEAGGKARRRRAE